MHVFFAKMYISTFFDRNTNGYFSISIQYKTKYNIMSCKYHFHAPWRFRSIPRGNFAREETLLNYQGKKSFLITNGMKVHFDRNAEKI